MTVNQLVKEVFSLGFEDVAECTEGFLFSANRALRQIYSELAGEKSSAIVAAPPKLTHHTELYLHEPYEKNIFHLKGGSLSFSFSGCGSYTIEDKNIKRVIGFGGDSGVIRELFDGECTLTFGGEFEYSIVDLVAFASNFCYVKENIPAYSEYTEIRLDKIIEDFSALTRAPENADGNPLTGAYSIGDTLYVPKNFSGKLRITYKPSPAAITKLDADKEIGIPRRLEHLLPILTASYLWLDDDEEKAEYYAAVYRSEANRLKVTSRGSIDASYNDVTGWAQ